VLGDEGRQPLGEGEAARAQTDEDQVIGATMALDDLVRHADKHPAEIVGVEDAALCGQ
jgi:hypothetical protein